MRAERGFYFALAGAIGLGLLGLPVIFEVSPDLGRRQVLWLVLGAGLGVALWVWAQPRALFHYHRIIYPSAVVLLLLVLLLGRGGARRWFSLGPISVQPSELAKPALIIVGAHLLSREPPGPLNTLKVLLAFGLAGLLVFVEPDLATSGSFAFAMLFLTFARRASSRLLAGVFGPPLAALTSVKAWAFGAYLALVALASRFLGRPKRLSSLWRGGWGYTLSLVFGVVAVGLAAPFVWTKVLKEYQRKRIIAFVNPGASPEARWQSLQAEIAIGSGGLSGKGYGRGTQRAYGFLPEPHTDFIVAALCEEFGAMVPILIIIFSTLILGGLVWAAWASELPYVRGIIYGAVGFLGYSMMVNMASTTGLIPVAGVPFPFLSYGGSQMVASWLALGLAGCGLRAQRRELGR